MLSATDRQLLRALNANSRQSLSELARALNLSRTTVKYRLAKLEESGVIAGYGVRLGDAFREQTIQTYVNLQVQPKLALKLYAQLKRIEQVEALFTVSGKFDIVLIVRTDTPTELDLVLDRIGELDGVLSTESAIVLSTRFDRR